MTTGTVLAFIFTGLTAPVAIVSGIWLEAQLPLSAAAAHRSAHSPAPAPPGGPAARRACRPAAIRPICATHPRTGSSPAAGTTGNGHRAARPAPAWVRVPLCGPRLAVSSGFAYPAA